MEMDQDKNPRLRILIVSTDMHIGGVTTALLALLHTLDYQKVDVDLLLYNHSGPLQDSIPKQVRLLPPAENPEGLRRLRRRLRVFSVPYLLGRFEAAFLENICNHPLQGLQLRSRLGARYSRRLRESYDLAISFLEFWPLYYTAEYVRASRKLAWIHIDYANCDLSVERDASAYPAYDRIVMVSETCVDNFRSLSPEFGSRAVYLPNLTSQEFIRFRSLQTPDVVLEGTGLRLITVARIQLAHKGIDRGVRAFDRLRCQGFLDGVSWYLIGDGPDAAYLQELICSLGREDEIILLGSRDNPLPILRQAHAFVLTSHYEGKPIAVTEAMILGLPVLATRYASVEEQITDGVDGLIVDNSEEGLVEGLYTLCQIPGMLDNLRRNVQAGHYGNEEDISRYYALFREIGLHLDG